MGIVVQGIAFLSAIKAQLVRLLVGSVSVFRVKVSGAQFIFCNANGIGLLVPQSWQGVLLQRVEFQKSRYEAVAGENWALVKWTEPSSHTSQIQGGCHAPTLAQDLQRKCWCIALSILQEKRSLP